MAWPFTSGRDVIPNPVRILAMIFTLMRIVLMLVRPAGIPHHALHYGNVYHFARIYTPLLMCLAAVAAQSRRIYLLAPIATMLPRLAIQLTSQAIGVMRWLK